ncbi:unnamed protein product [Acanthoscelides obtectus]|uniref:Uncharacterized protein n=1 Tax=Acanthoscelides obtectus TaxID=200917 RepID=A0A9P0LI24_ACAOB|nr:unnamed protein product [Acanthoscelides obtectus]CAK1681235.1 hypothetical protein AOBTE_LOCUS33073 [Acanthoscelides obtectus]
MDDIGAGPSQPKKRKVTFKNPNALTDAELLSILECSDSDLEEIPSDVDDFEPDSQSEESSDDDNEDKRYIFCFVLFYIVYFIADTSLPPQNPQIHKPLPTAAIASSDTPSWCDDPPGMKSI